MNSIKRQNDRILKEELPRSVGQGPRAGEHAATSPLMRTQEARSLGGCLQDAAEAEGGAGLLGCCAQAPLHGQCWQQSCPGIKQGYEFAVWLRKLKRGSVST